MFMIVILQCWLCKQNDYFMSEWYEISALSVCLVVMMQWICQEISILGFYTVVVVCINEVATLTGINVIKLLQV